MVSVPIRIPSSLHFSPEQFERLAIANPDLRMELTAQGELIVMPPTGSEGGRRNVEISTDLTLWNRQSGLGVVFDSSTGFRLPNGAIRSPDTAWVAQDRWQNLTPTQRQGFAPLCPDFVLELASETDSLDDLRVKMQEYMDNGCRLGWLLDPKTQQVEIYRPGQSVEILQSPAVLVAESVLPGFTLDLKRTFESDE